MSPYAAAAAAVLLAASHGGVAYLAHQAGEDKVTAQQEREDTVRQKTYDDAQRATADVIAKLKPRNVTIRQETEREIHTNTVYRDCRHGLDGLRLVNEALTGRPEPAGGSELPGANAPP